MTEEDDSLRRQFSELRALDAGRAPAFDAMMQRRPPRRSNVLPFVVVPMAMLTVAAAAGFMLWLKTSHTPVQHAMQPPQAHTAEPLAFLLDADFDSVHLEGP